MDKPHLRDYQCDMVNAIKARRQLLVVAPMGAGKTLATLTAIYELTKSTASRVRRVLILAPKRVAQCVWVQESQQFFGTSLNIRYCERAADVKLHLITPAPHHIAVCSVTRIDELPHGCWDMVVMDESTLFKHKRANRSTEARRICNGVVRRVALTGTPIHNGHEGLWHQCFLLDAGKALGRTLTEFRNRYEYIKYRVNGVVSVYELDPARFPALLRDVRPLVHVVNPTIDLPECLYKTVRIEMPEAQMKQYRKFEAENVTTFEEQTGTQAYSEDPKTLVAFSRTSLGMKLRQFASGLVYTDESHKSYTVAHTAKLTFLKDFAGTVDGNIIVMYQFQSELAELKKTFPAGRQLTDDKDVEDWNKGKIRVAFAHPASIGHGLNLQFGGHTMIWFSLTYDAELYAQANKRLHRSGQSQPVSIVHLITKDTIEERVLKILQKKEDSAKTFFDESKDA